jgi:hypothetical protein
VAGTDSRRLALALVLILAAITMDRLMVRTTLAAYLLFAVPHLIFHLTHHQHYTASQAIGESTALAIAVLPLGLLALTLRRKSLIRGCSQPRCVSRRTLTRVSKYS